MISIDEIIQSLSDSERKQLVYAFENEFTKIVHLQDSKFISVNIKPSNKYLVEEEQGVWAYGTVQNSQ